MNAFTAELVGTAILVLLGNGVVANVVLKKTLGHQSGWIVITFGWAIAVFTGVFVSAPYSGGHLNPAVTIGIAMVGGVSWSIAAGYILAQFLGAFIGSTLVYLSYKDHYAATEDRDGILGTFCNAPAIPNTFSNLITEIVGTFVLVFGVLQMTQPEHKLGALDALPAGLLVLGIGLSLGGPTGYAINPARDLGPRIMHALLPIPNKRDSNWSYSYIPVLGPVVGALLGAGLHLALS